MQLGQFSGTWVFVSDASNLKTPPPNSWVQYISLENDRLHVREEIVRGTETSIVEVNAAADSTFYPVAGSPIADEIAYEVSGNAINGQGRKGGQNTFREVIAMLTPDRVTMELFLQMGDKEIPLGTDHFDRQK
jgi:hypothetical protein